MLNIVEAGGRKTYKEKRHLLHVSFGSLKETKYLLGLARELKIVSQYDFDKIYPSLEELAKKMF